MNIRIILIFLLFLIKHSIAGGLNNNDNKLYTFLISKSYQSIPIQYINGALYVKGKINNQPSVFLLDTGSDAIMSILSKGIIKLKLTPQSTTHLTANSAGQLHGTQAVSLDKLEIGPVLLKNTKAAIMEQASDNGSLKVILGISFFIKYNAIIDINNHLLYLSTKPLEKKDQHQLNNILTGGHFQALPLTELPSHHLILPIQINKSEPGYFLFDTGFSNTALSIPYAKYLKIPLGIINTEKATNGTVSFSSIKLNQVIFNSLQTFYSKPILLKDVRADAINMEAMASFLGVVGVIGLAEMEKTGTILDIASRTAYLHY
ncbi:MAG: hypothetical protein K0R49_960 [Burkholderiales bacterium]|jgi:predicted aspartyl protease|nr:hypothetical protein [Burkholderiales bacterium]